MTARWTPYTDSTGVKWDPRSSSLGTNRSTLLLQNADIIGTERDDLYQVGAIGVTGYRLAVPRPGTYQVRVLTAEPYWSAPGKRVFDISAENLPAASDVDIFRSVGKGTAFDVSFLVGVADGTLDLRFTAKADLAVVTAIEVTEVKEAPVPPKKVQTFASRMVAASTDVVDSAGNTWRRRGPGFGSTRLNTNLVGKEVANTEEDALYRTSAFGMKGMLVPVSAAADYRVRLLLAEGYWTEPGKRVFDVRAEGKTVATGVDIVAAAGPRAAHDVVFDTPVTDGMLTLEFPARADLPMIAGIEVTSTDPTAAIDLPSASLIPLSGSSVFHQDLTNAPRAENSGAVMERLRKNIDGGYGYSAGVNAYQYNSAFYTATPTTPRHTVSFYDCQNKGWIPTSLYDGPRYFVDVPIPDGAVPATGTDAQLGVYDPSTDQLWEFWVMRRTSTGGWEACWGGRIDDVKSSHGAFPAPFGVSASGLAMAGGVVSIQEAARGQIDHALYLTVTEAKALGFSYPANRTDGRTDAEDVPMEGQRLRLDPSIDVTTLGLTTFGQAVARAAQKYGFIVSDIGGAVAIATESGRPDERRTGLNPWDVLLGGPSYLALAKFPWERVELIEADHGKPEDAPSEPTPTTTPTASATPTATR
ncbi:malectin domain-containing carbohydrate-binding protein [Mobilicoccus massiliensis]|uniref:malectin domain-containing carbohydrate-binding protein n=1 Tax=Mobilicoccus massiliensis TaxID=1522310 RepID=UPI000694FE56|nr:malectin domain-containing carbohydrate-binding protein [Mobilicoccus massiliensis]